MIKLEEGKYYRTLDDRKVGPMKPSGHDDWPWIVIEGDGLCWNDDGTPVEETESPLLVAEWTDEPKFWRDMTPEEKGALLLAHHEGEVVEEYTYTISGGMWIKRLMPFVKQPFSEYGVYRVRPEPKRETLHIYGQNQDFGSYQSPFHTHRITFDTIDGEPDCESIKMEKL